MGRKLEVKSTVLTAPWKGFRLGINLLLKNSKTRLEIFKRHRKVEYLYKLFDEIWDTYYGQSITSRNVVEFTDSVLKHSQHYKTSQFFTVWHRRRKVLYVGKKLFNKFMDLKLTMRKENFSKADLALKYKKSYMRSGKFPLTYHFLKRKKTNSGSLKGKKKTTFKEKKKEYSFCERKKKEYS